MEPSIELKLEIQLLQWYTYHLRQEKLFGPFSLYFWYLWAPLIRPGRGCCCKKWPFSYMQSPMIVIEYM